MSADRTALRGARGYFDGKVQGLADGYRSYRWESSPLRREHYAQTREAIARELSGRRFMRMLEVGPGACIWTALFAGHADQLAAVDLSWAMLQDARRTAPPAALSCGDAMRLPFASAAFDALCTVRAFEYFPDPESALREFHRVLRPGAYLMIITKNREYAGYLPPRGYRSAGTKQDVHSGNLTAAELSHMVERVGFEGIRLQSALLGRTRVAALWRLVRWARQIHDARWSRLVDVWSESVMLTARRA